MRFDVVTLFPEMFAPLLTSGITRRAFETGQVDVRLVNPRDFSSGNYKRVDDRPFGGGPGMVMMAEPLDQCLKNIQAQRADAVPVVLFSPLGKALNHAMVARWADSQGAVLICGRYEGLDQRFIDEFVDEQWSLGDFVLSGGEIAALAMIDAAVRLMPGALHHGDSFLQDSFQDSISGLLDSPHYTRPEVLWGQPVPPILTSGDHANIAQWRREQSLALTANNRPDLLLQARKLGLLSKKDEQFLAKLNPTLSPP